MFVGNSRLRLVADLKDLSHVGSVSSRLENFPLYLPWQIYLLMFLVQETHLFVLSKKSYLSSL